MLLHARAGEAARRGELSLALPADRGATIRRWRAGWRASKRCRVTSRTYPPHWREPRSARAPAGMSAPSNPMIPFRPAFRVARNWSLTSIMSNYTQVHVEFPGRIMFVGFGSIGQGVLPLILRHIGITPERITIVTADDARRAGSGQATASSFIKEPLTRENFRRVLDPLMGRGDFLLNLSVDVSSIALIKLCWEKGAMYLDTCIEPWPGGYTDPTVPPARRTNYALREEALALRAWQRSARPTAVLTHGANPGLVSHFVKQALLNIAADIGRRCRSARNARGVGRAGAQARRQGHPHRRARHAGVQQAEGAGRVRQHLVGGRLRERGLRSRPSSAGARTSATSRATASATISAAARDLPDAAGRGDARAHLDAARRALPRLPASRTANRSRSPTTTPCARARRSPTGRPCTTPITRATRP